MADEISACKQRKWAYNRISELIPGWRAGISKIMLLELTKSQFLRINTLYLQLEESDDVE